MVTSHIASRLLAQSAIYPGLTDVVADLVSSGGSVLYGVRLPDDFIGLSFEEAPYRFRAQHQAMLVAVRRDGDVQFSAPRDLVLRPDNAEVVIAEHLGRLAAAPHSDVPRHEAAFAQGAAPHRTRVAQVGESIRSGRT